MKNEKQIVTFSQELRKNMTKEERRLWYDFLKNLPVTVHRQKVIGKYIADFYIASAKIIIELDGSQHYEETAQKRDAERDEYFRQNKIKVLRYSNYDINTDFDSVCSDILSALSSTSHGE